MYLSRRQNRGDPLPPASPASRFRSSKVHRLSGSGAHDETLDMSRNGADHASQTIESAVAGARVPPEITAVICTHNRYDVLADAVASLRGQSIDPMDLEILVVDNS